MRGYRAEQACCKASERAKNNRNARRIEPKVWAEVNFYLGIQWISAQIAGKVPVSHENVYLHVYADKVVEGDLYKNLRIKKVSRRRHLSERDRRGQIPSRRSISERPSHIEDRKQVGHRAVDTVIGSSHKQAIMKLVDHKNGFAVLPKVSNKSANLVCRAIEAKLKPLNSKVNTLETPHENRHRRRVDYDRKRMESPVKKMVGIQDTQRGFSRRVKPCCTSYLKPP
jgi:IS30 family transposase